MGTVEETRSLWGMSDGMIQETGNGGDYEHKWMWVAPKKAGFPEKVCSGALLGFGDFEEWIYGEISTDKPHYV